LNDLTRGNGLDTLFYLADCTSRRVSSYDVEGANDDWYTLQPGEIRELANIQGCGIIRHIWCTLLALYPKDMSNVPYYPRKIVLRTYWDGETSPSIEAPIGDFFGIGHGVLKEFCSEPLCMSPTDGRGLNCFFPMPFSDGARFTLQNETDGELHFFFYIDYEQHITLPPDCGRFHTQWRREKNTNGWMPVEPGYCFRPEFMDKERTWYTNHWKVKNLTGDDNYVILEARGKGKYVGCNLNIDQFEQQGNYWYGEGDDMIFIDALLYELFCRLALLLVFCKHVDPDVAVNKDLTLHNTHYGQTYRTHLFFYWMKQI